MLDLPNFKYKNPDFGRRLIVVCFTPTDTALFYEIGCAVIVCLYRLFVSGFFYHFSKYQNVTFFDHLVSSLYLTM